MFTQDFGTLYRPTHVVPIRIFGIHMALLTNNRRLARTLSHHFAPYREQAPGPHALRVYLLEAEAPDRRYSLTVPIFPSRETARASVGGNWSSLLEQTGLQRGVEAYWTGREFYFVGKWASMPNRAVNAVILALVVGMSQDGYVPLRAFALMGRTGAVALVSDSLDVSHRVMNLLLRRGCRLATNHWLLVRPAAQGIQMAGLTAQEWTGDASTGAHLFSALSLRFRHGREMAPDVGEKGALLLGVGSIGLLKDIHVLRERAGAVGWRTRALDQAELLGALKEAALHLGDPLSAADPAELDACLRSVSSSTPGYEVAGQIPIDWVARVVLRSLSDERVELRREA